jgi:predicted enzyme related to lactoylglutathione lyase
MLELLANIDVEDVDEAADFYCKALGLKIGRRLGAGAVELVGASSAIYLLQKPAGSAPAPGASHGRDYSRHWTPVHLDFVVTDIDEAVRAAQACGALLEGAIRTQNWGRIAVLADPFGNGFCLIQFLGRGYDAIAAG